MNKDSKIYVAGHRGLVGSAIWNNLISKGYTNLIGATHQELDLLDGVSVKAFFDKEKPEYVILAAAHVGGDNGKQYLSSRLYLREFADSTERDRREFSASREKVTLFR